MDGSLVSLSGLLIGNHIFDVPVFQRSYAWERKNLEDLWEDIYYMDPSKVDSLVTRVFSGWFCGVRAVRREGFGCSGRGLCCGR